MAPELDPLQMTEDDTERLLRRLLPAFLWARDDGTLSDLIRLIARQYWDLHTGLGVLYNAMFIQTCPEPVVPYIAQGIGVTGLEPGGSPDIGSGVSQRAWAGRIISFRVHKGTLATLGRAAIAASGWPTFVTSGLDTIARTPSLRYPGLPLARWPDIRRLPPSDPGTVVFEPLTRTAGISGRQFTGSAGETAAISFFPGAGGQPVPGGVELSVWRLQAFPLTWRTPHPVSGRPGGYTFDPLGIDSPLFVQPLTADQRLDAPGRDEIPVPLSRTALAAALRAGQVPPPLAVRIIGQGTGQTAARSAEPLAAGRLAAADLTNWAAPAGTTATAVIDPELGRLLFPEPPPTESVVVDYAYGFPGEVGGGPYGTVTNWQQTPANARFCDVAKQREPDQAAGPQPGRPLSLPDPLDPYAPAPAGTAGGQTGEPDSAQSAGPVRVSALEDALAWAEQQDPLTWCIITIGDSGTYTAPPGGWQLTLAKNQRVRIISAPEASPALTGALQVRGGDLSVMEISGLLLGSPLTYQGTGQIAIEHTAIWTGNGAAAVRIGGAAQASLSSCLVGPVEAGPDVSLSVADTIADARGGAAITCQPGTRSDPGGTVPGGLDIKRTTVLGTTAADIITAEDSIFAGLVTARLPHRGLIRYSYYPAGSAPPPLVAGPVAGRVAGATEATGATGASGPQFTSTRFGDAAYGQLAPTCPPQIAAGARLGGEMGVYNSLQQSLRAARLLNALDEMLPAGRTATVIYRT